MHIEIVHDRLFVPILTPNHSALRLISYLHDVQLELYFPTSCLILGWMARSSSGAGCRDGHQFVIASDYLMELLMSASVGRSILAGGY